VALVNGEPIPHEEFQKTLNKLLESYRLLYIQQSGESFDDLLAGTSGAYYELQVGYQAAEQLIGRELIRQEAERRGVYPSAAEVEQAFQERYRQFLDLHGMTEQDLDDLLRDPEKRHLTQQLLGIEDESLEALKARTRREIESTLLERRFIETVLGVDPDSKEGKERLSEWLERAWEENEIEFRDPWLRAFYLQQRIDRGKSLEEKKRRLEEALAAYETLRRDLEGGQGDPDSLNLVGFLLAQLHNMRVSLDRQLERQLQALSQAEADKADEIAKLREEISESREKASQLFLSAVEGDEETASEQQYVAFLNADPDNPFYYYLYAQFLLSQKGRLPLALRMVLRAIELAPDYVDAHVLLGDLNVERENYASALENYRQALSILEETGDIQGSERFKVSNSQPEEIRLKLAETYLRWVKRMDELGEKPTQIAADDGDPREYALKQAEDLLQSLLAAFGETDPKAAAVLADLGDLERLRGNYSEALQRYEESLQRLDDAEVRVRLGEALILAGRIAEAEGLFRALIERLPAWAPAHLGLAEVYRAQGDVADALDEYKAAFRWASDLSYYEHRQIGLKALALDPQDLELRLMLGDFYLKNHVYQGAREQFEAALDLDPGSSAAYRGLGQIALEKREYEQALQYFEKALAQNASTAEQIELYRLIVQAERSLAGPGKPISERGQEALYRLAQLYLETRDLQRSWVYIRHLRVRYPDYRPQEVEALRQELSELVGDRLPGLPVRDLGSRVIAPGEPHPAYNSVPPTSGWHYAIPARWGIHDSPIPNEVQLRNLAGGGVLIQHRPDLDRETLGELRALVAELRKDPRYCKLLLAPYPGLEKGIALTAWNRIDAFDGFERERILGFIDAFLGGGPEADEVGCLSNE
jgi:tetratricopeptide (TPR) repeat protein